jgi:hypothetical protein
MGIILIIVLLTISYSLGIVVCKIEELGCTY